MIIDWFKDPGPPWQALLATLFTRLLTVLGASTVFFFKSINRKVLDGMLGFAAGAMIFVVVVEELIPESQLEKNTDVATIGSLPGFAVMMTLDVALGRPVRHPILSSCHNT
jgi:ZIP family zinc transporter